MTRVGVFSKAVVAVALFALSVVPARADAYLFGWSGYAYQMLTIDGSTQLEALDQGQYLEDGFHDPDQLNYLVGLCCQGDDLEYRNWFAFDISGVTAPVTSLTLTLFSDEVTASGNYYLNDVAGSLADLIDGTGGVAAFDDLGSGANFGFRFYEDTESYEEHGIALNAAALASLNAAIARQHSVWALGGAFVAGDTPIPPPSVPEPVTGGLLALGVAALAARRRLA